MWYVLLVFIVVIGICSLIAKSPAWKGKSGERAVKSVLGQTTPGFQYVLNDYIIVQDGKSSQIDHILLNSHGIFVIETKNYSGKIYGKENQLQWTQSLNYGREKHSFYNPIKQNATHAYRIKALVKGLPFYVPVYSYVVFVQNNPPRPPSNKVVALSQLGQAIRIGSAVLSVSQMEEIHSLLVSKNLRKQLSNSEHIANIQLQKKSISNNTCPRCGGNLVPRNGKYGPFYGCSNYPNCRFIKK